MGILGAVLVLSMLCAVLFVRSLFHDDCTGTFARSPQAVAEAYVHAVAAGDVQAAQACWEHFAWFDVEAGCSEICVQRIAGRNFTLKGMEITGETENPPEERARLEVLVRVTCGQGTMPLEGSLTLDSTASPLPWRHWKIIHSTFGGQMSHLWCGE